jgi:hypothetical protein
MTAVIHRDVLAAWLPVLNVRTGDDAAWRLQQLFFRADAAKDQLRGVHRAVYGCPDETLLRELNTAAAQAEHAGDRLADVVTSLRRQTSDRWQLATRSTHPTRPARPYDGRR